MTFFTLLKINVFFNFLNFIHPEYMTLCVTHILEKGYPTHQWGKIV